MPFYYRIFTALNEWSARLRELYLTKHNNTTDRQICRRRESNPQSQQASGHRTTPHTARPLWQATAYPADINCSLQLLKAGKCWIAQQAPSAKGKVWADLFTDWLPCCMLHSASWEDKRFAASQEIRSILWNLQGHYHIHKWQPPVPILSHLNPVNT